MLFVMIKSVMVLITVTYQLIHNDFQKCLRLHRLSDLPLVIASF